MADLGSSNASRGFGERSVFWMILVCAVVVTLLIAVVVAASEGGKGDYAEDAASESH